MPTLADGFTVRPETAPGLAGLLVPGAAVALVGAAAGVPRQPAGPCGKTQLAVHAAGELWRSGQVDLLAWVDAGSRACVLSGYAEAAAAAGIEADGSAEQVAERLAGWLAETGRPWLIVLDDLRDAADLDGLWPRGPAGRVLVTARDEAVPAGLGARVLPVGPFSTREALSYLMASLAGDPDQRHGAIDLAIALAGDPVALAQASALITTTTWSCREYQQHYASHAARLAERHAGGAPPPPLAVTWQLSAERAAQLAPGGATGLLLGLAALLDGQPVPGPLFTTAAVRGYLAGAGAPAAAADRPWDAVAALQDTGLLTVDPAPATPVARVSRLVAALARAAMPEQALRRAAAATADALMEIWPRPEPQPWLAAPLRSAAAALTRTAADRLWDTDACHPLLHTSGDSIDNARLTGPAVRYWAQHVTTSDRILGPASPHTLTAASHLAQAHLAAGHPDQAAQWWRWVAAGHARRSGPGDPSALGAQVRLGRALAAAGQPGDAVTVLEQALAGHEQAHGPGHPATLHARAELAAACQAAGRPAEAIGHHRRILADQERIHGARHPAAITAREQLAAAYQADGRLKSAITAYQKALTDRQRAQGPDHLDTITTRRNLAAAHQAAGNISAALQLHDQACDGYQQTLGPSHPGTLACRAGLASAYHAAGRLADATTLLRDTLTRCQQALPPGHPVTTSVQRTLASIASA